MDRFSSLEAGGLVLPPDGRQSPTALDVCRGARRLLRGLGFATLTEMVLPDGRRADIVGLGGDGTIHIVEVKSSIADFRADTKWRDYRAHCDRLSFAIADTIPPELMPEDAGLIAADAYGAEMLRPPPEHRLGAATRKMLLVRFGTLAAGRLHGLADGEAWEG